MGHQCTQLIYSISVEEISHNDTNSYVLLTPTSKDVYINIIN
jgi:hypothetical protein